MSDVDGDETAAPVVADTGAPAAPMDINEALQQVLKAALVVDGLARGLNETATALDKRQAHLCVLAENCDEPSYKKLIQALCTEHSIPIVMVDDNKALGVWSGLCKIDAEGKPRKVIRTSSVAVRDWGKEGPAHDFVQEYIKSQKS